MITRRIPGTSEFLPVMGLGTWQAFDVGPSEPARTPLRRVLEDFSALGGRVVDTSPVYGQAESVVGALSEELGLGGKLFLASKVWASGKAEGVRQMEGSMRLLHREVLDLMQVQDLVDVETQLDTLEEWKRAGRVRYVGVTHHPASAYQAVAKVLSSRAVDFVQINYSVEEREAERQLLPLAAVRRIAVIANRPLGGGVLLGRLRGRPVPAWASTLGCDSWAELLLKFVISHPSVTCTILATSQLGHLRENMKAGLGRMPHPEQRARIAAEAAGAPSDKE